MQAAGVFASGTACATSGSGRSNRNRAFRRETRLGFRRWREQARRRLALKRLAHGEWVPTVAMDHGYSSQSAFSQCSSGISTRRRRRFMRSACPARRQR